MEDAQLAFLQAVTRLPDNYRFGPTTNNLTILQAHLNTKAPTHTLLLLQLWTERTLGSVLPTSKKSRKRTRIQPNFNPGTQQAPQVTWATHGFSPLCRPNV